MKHLLIFGLKTIRDSAESTQSGSATHDSGYAEPAMPPTRPPASHPLESNMAGHRSSKSVSRGAPGVYGIVSFDFKAERPDELDARVRI